ncbi:putative antitoxin YwqK [compost metagenome]
MKRSLILFFGISSAAVLGTASLIFAGVKLNYFLKSNTPGLRDMADNATFEGHPFTGLIYQFHENSRIYKIKFFFAGLQSFTEHRWYDNGVKWEEIEFKSGKLHGNHRIWYPDGRVKFLKSFHENLPHGEFWGWHPNGVVSDFQYFEQGQEIAYKSFVSDGKPYYNYVYKDNDRVGMQGGRFCKSVTRQ